VQKYSVALHVIGFREAKELDGTEKPLRVRLRVELLGHEGNFDNCGEIGLSLLVEHGAGRSQRKLYPEMQGRVGEGEK
jgi:hypothetical protein